ncbi:MAG: LamG domain-containing protein [Verrucomicrobiaceae bacterium]|nr:MAG: LamG domain-containing protein [Verrucomicrobiaceae bacterium]
MADIDLAYADDATLAAIRAALKAADVARALRFADAEVSPPSPVLPNVAGRSDKVLGFNSLGAPVATAGASSITTAILALSPYVYWPLNETSGTVIADASGNARNATLSGSVTLAQTGPDGGANAMTFIAGRVTAGTTWNHTDWTAVAWVKPTFSAPASDPALFCQHESGSVRYSTHFAADREGFVGWNGTTALIADGAAQIIDLLKDNLWYHVAIVRKSSGRMVFHVNGRAYCGGAFTLGAVTTQPLTFGASTTAFATPFVGSAAHLAYWNRVLSEREIWKLYAGG